MKALLAALTIVLLIAAIAFGAWGWNAGTLPEGRFLVEPETIVKGSDLFVQRLTIIANGAQGIRLTHGEGDSSWLSLEHAPAAADGLQHVHLVLVADKSLDLGTDHCSITWLEQITTPNGAHVGGPSRYVVPRDTELDEFVQLELPQGEYATGDTLRLGLVDGEPVEVSVEPHERAIERE
jgi:hypothetical protein